MHMPFQAFVRHSKNKIKEMSRRATLFSILLYMNISNEILKKSNIFMIYVNYIDKIFVCKGSMFTI